MEMNRTTSTNIETSATSAADCMAMCMCPCMQIVGEKAGT